MAGITFFIGLFAGLGLVHAQSSVPSSSLCPTANGRTVYDTNGAGYLVTCSADNDRGSYTNTRATSSYLDCMSAWNADTVCVGFTYVGGNGGSGSGTCWLKSEMLDYPSSSPNVISAVRAYNATNSDDTPSFIGVSSSSISSSSEPTASSVTPSASPVASGNLCPSYNFTTYADNEDNNWQVLCGFDTSPSPFGVKDVPDFASCLEACNVEDECIAVAFIINQANYPVPSRDEVYSGRGCGSVLPAGQLPGGSTTQFFINSAGLNRSFSVHVPSSYNTNSAAPLIFAFHGRSETPVNIEGYSGLSSEATNPYGIVVYPLGVAANESGYPEWQSDPDTVNRTPYVDDQTFVQDLIVHMTSNYCIDTSRILATGFYNGGGLVGVLACNSSLSNQFSAFAINAGAQYTNDSDTADCPQSGNVPSTILTNTLVQPVCSPGRQDVPILEFHGDADGTISYNGGPRRGYCVPKIPHWVSYWSVRNGMTNASVITPLANGQVTKYEYGTGENQGLVTHYKIAGWNHAWVGTADGAPIDSTPIILQFLYRFLNPNALRYIPAPPSSPGVPSAVSSSTSVSATPSPSAGLASISVNLSSVGLPITTAVGSPTSNISLHLNTTTRVSVPLTTAASSLPLNVSIVAKSTTTVLNLSTIALPSTAILSSFSTSTTAHFTNATATTSTFTAISTPSSTSVSCPASNGTFYTDPSTGSTFEVQCGDNNTAIAEPVDSDSITVQGATLQDCIGFCAALRPSCQGVDMRNGTCYLETTTERAGRVEGARLVKSLGR